MPESRMLINYVPGEACRVAIVEDGKLGEFYSERFDAASRVWTVGTLGANGSATLRITGITFPPDGEAIAIVQPGTVNGVANQDPNTGNNRGQARWRVDYAHADLAVSVSGPGGDRIAGQLVGVTVSVVNRSALTVDDVVVQVPRYGVDGRGDEPKNGRAIGELALEVGSPAIECPVRPPATPV